MRRLLHGRLLVPLAVASAVGLTACGGGSSSARVATPGSAARLIAATADATGAAKTARLSGSLSVRRPGKSIDARFDGAVDFSTPALSLSIDLARLGLPGASGAVELRLVHGVVYMNLGALGLAAGRLGLTGGTSWVKLDLTSLLGQAGGLSGLGQVDPTTMLDALRGVSAGVRDLGRETVGGAETTHYRAEIDVRKAVAALPSELRDSVGPRLEQMFTGGRLPVDVWLDAQGRARRMRESVFVAHVDIVVTMDLSDFGVPVDVQAPPAGEVVDLSQLLGRALSGATS